MTIAETIALPPARWREAKQLRLEALLAEPTAFASSYEDESAFSDDLWISRLSTAYKRDGNLTFFAEVEGALVGMAGATWSAKAKLRHLATIYGVYVMPEMRGRGIGIALMGRLLAELRSTAPICKASLTVNTASEPAVSLYQTLGFKIVGTARRELKVDQRFYDLHWMELHFDENSAIA